MCKDNGRSLQVFVERMDLYEINPPSLYMKISPERLGGGRRARGKRQVLFLCLPPFFLFFSFFFFFFFYGKAGLAKAHFLCLFLLHCLSYLYIIGITTRNLYFGLSFCIPLSPFFFFCFPFSLFPLRTGWRVEFRFLQAAAFSFLFIFYFFCFCFCSFSFFSL